MKPITIIAICVICAATLMSGCLNFTESATEKEYCWGSLSDPEYVATPRPIMEPVESMNASGDCNVIMNATETYPLYAMATDICIGE